MWLAIALASAQVSTSSGNGEYYAAIWNDAMLNAMIGNGNDLVTSDWYMGHDDGHPPTIRISDLRCRPLFGQRNCRFRLSRTAHPQSSRPVEDGAEHPRLTCSATFHRPRRQDGPRRWDVLHFPPGDRGGHSRTSMRCRVDRRD